MRVFVCLGRDMRPGAVWIFYEILVVLGLFLKTCKVKSSRSLAYSSLGSIARFDRYRIYSNPFNPL